MGLLHWAAMFLVIAIIAAIFGFGNIVEGAAGIATILFVLFLVLFIITVIVNLVRR